MQEVLPLSLVSFVRTLRSKGLNDSFIYKHIESAGWDATTIKKALESPAAHSFSYALDPALLTFIVRSLDEKQPHGILLEVLVKNGWSVGAIRHALGHAQEILETGNYAGIFGEKSKESFVQKHKQHFFSKASLKEKFTSDEDQTAPSSRLLDRAKGDKTESSKEIDNAKLHEEMLKLKEDFERREKQMLESERLRREDILSQKLDELQRTIATGSLKQPVQQVQPTQVVQAPQIMPPPQIVMDIPSQQQVPIQQVQQVQAQQTHPHHHAHVPTNPSQQAPIVVVKDSGASLQALEQKFASMVESRGNYYAYTNPIIPERLHLVNTPQGDRVQTGIIGLDPVIEGGLRRDTITLVGGGPGTGKSTFCLQFLVNGILKYNEPGIYISFEETKESIFELGRQFDWNLEQLEKDNKLVIKEYTPEQVDKILEAGGGTLRDLIDSVKAKRIVVDSITAFMLLYEGEIAQRRACLRLFRSLSKWECTTLAIAEEQGNMGQHDASVLEYETAAVILLYNERKGDLRQRSLEIFKMRGTKHAGRIFPMRITDQGMEVYPRETF